MCATNNVVERALRLRCLASSPVERRIREFGESVSCENLSNFASTGRAILEAAEIGSACGKSVTFRRAGYALVRRENRSSMAKHFAERNHYNPCFWAACWNIAYFNALVESKSKSLRAREQEVFVLNLLSDKIYRDRVKNVHFDKDLGVAELTPQTMKDFCRRRYPSEYEHFCQSMENHEEILCMDFEDILNGTEKSESYKSLMEAVVAGDVQSVVHKGFLACHIILQAMRSHEMMNSMIDTLDSLGIPKWEYFWMLKNAWGNKLILARAATPLAFSRWLLYVTDKHMYPLCDSPVMINKNTLMAVLSPRILLEIIISEPVPENTWKVREGISSSKYREFRRRSIQNSFKHIIFHDPEELKLWQNTPEFRVRSRDLRDSTKAAGLRAEAANRVIWAINGFGKLPYDFEHRIKSLIDA